MFVLSFIVLPINAAEPRLVWTFYWEGIDVQIYAPHQAYPNDTVTIRIRVEARESLRNVTIHFKVYGTKSKGYVLWYNSFYALRNVDLPFGVVEDQYFDMNIPEDVDPGLIYSETSCSWMVQRELSWQDQYREGAFRVTYLRNKPYEDLQVAYNQLLTNYNSLLNSYNTLQTNYNQLLADYNSLQTSYNNLQTNYSTLENNHNDLQTNYNSLNTTYHNLLSDHSSLQASFNELKSKYEFAGETANALDLMYVFIETTVIFIATTIYFVLRKRKPKKQT